MRSTKPRSRVPSDEFDLDPLFAALRVEPRRVLEPVITRQQRACLVEQLGPQGWLDLGGQFGLTGDHPLPRRVDERHRGVAATLGGGQRVQLLEGGVHDRPAYLRGGRRFRQPVDRAEPVQQRALLEVAGPRRRQRRTPDVRGRLVAHESQRMTTPRQPRAPVPARLLAG